MKKILGNLLLQQGKFELYDIFSLNAGLDGTTPVGNGGRGSNVWVAPNWAKLGGVAVGTPSLGGELATNGNMELDSNWTTLGTPTTHERSNEQAHSLTYSRKVISDAAGEGFYQGIAAGINVGDWAVGTGWFYITAGSAHLQLFGSGAATIGATSIWTQSVAARRRISNTFLTAASVAAASTYYGDDFSIKVATQPSLFALLQGLPVDNVLVSVLLPVSVFNTPAGIAINANNAANPSEFIIAYHNQASPSLFIDKLVGGTWTNVTSAFSPAYSQYSRIAIYKNGTSYTLYYGGYLVGTYVIADVTASAIHGMFSAYSGNSLDEFAVHIGAPQILSVIGDSISSVTPATSTAMDKWVSLMVNHYQFGMMNHLNHAVAGQTIMAHMDAQVAAAAGDNSDIAIFALGTNDADNPAITAEYQENIIEFHGTNPNAYIYCMGILPRTGGNRAANNPRIEAAVTNAAALGVPCTYWNTDGWIDPATDTTDGLHPNAAGNIKIRDQALALLA